MKKITLVLTLLLVSSVAFSQLKISGVVSDQNKDPLPGASVLEKGTTNGTSTDFDGNYELTVGDNAVLVVSFAGYETKEVSVNGRTNLNISLSEGLLLEEIVVTGNRAKPRTILDSPVPIDNIDVQELQRSGKPTFDRMLVFKVPSFNSQNQAISDATAHYDPADLRGMGPSRTLVLINGKRKNQSAQVYLNRTPGKGEVGVDLKSIPTAAIDRVEVLRDGASAQYGSDAIAGVLNIILKKDQEYSTFTSKAGITSQNDGFNFAADYNTSFEFGNEGFVNLTLGYYKQNITNRAGIVSDTGSTPRDVAWLAANPTANMTVGQPEMEKGDLFINAEHPFGDNATLYTFHGFTTRTGKSFAYYRAPYWRNDVANANFITANPNDFIGYQPTFETAIDDHINSAGIRFDINDKWKADASITFGSNDVFYTVNNSVNRDYLADHGTSPRTFNPGGYRLTNVINNLDVSGLISEEVSVALGLEYKKESFRAFEGNPLSYYKGGSDSFAGIKPAEAGLWSRNNFAAYAQLDYDVSEDLLLGVAGRFEDFTDAGTNFSWKVNGRYKLGENGAIRASYSTGFRAPTLHQRHITLSQYIIVAGSSEPLLQGTLANDNSAVQALGVPNLTHETSKNISAGLTYKFDRNISASLDFYNIKVNDRVLFSSQIGTLDGNLDGSDSVEQILINNNVVAVQFFINAGNTSTTGADLVLNYKNLFEVGEGKVNASLAANFNTTTFDAINTPSALASGGYNIFDRQEQGLITNSRPKSKFILGLNYVGDKWDWSLNNTRFGEVTITAPQSGGTDQALAAKVSTDLGFVYKLTDKISFNGNINNIFDVYPDVTLTSTNTAQAGSRFLYSSEVQQLGQLGTNFALGLNFQF
ncbi:iron complex outermembrane receptor protein [Lutibacter sp. Hel_I_33_5]|uniref:TonB-dependent receptor n=1 Tax=Lutibacter sp. Hel_I_33_5 TaxID=1566289 RepID=UPI00119D9F9F|nr:TonB-dependent receptor [Lutibacter sp. Hel_I_33_5]TVZ55087.1 iron complex outermembrane receptor protein [Lutibacter sp. Hel_I_33_5]